MTVTPTICAPCTERLRHHLTTIPTLYSQLDTDLVKGAPAEGARRKVSGSPALMRLEVLALIDPRTKWDGQRGQPRYIPDRVGYWAHRYCRDTRTNSDFRKMGEATAFLTAMIPNIPSLPWAAAIIDELDDIAGQLGRITGEPAGNIECDMECDRRTYKTRRKLVNAV